MAASAPPPNWIDSQSSEEVGSVGTKGLELKMSGMSLMTSFADAPGYSAFADGPGLSAFAGTPALSAFSDTPGLSGSTVSTYSNDDPRPPVNDSIDQSSLKGSAPTSPLQDSTEQTADKSFAKPPGLAGAMPSPIGEPGHSKNSSATSPLVTLTPNSSVDGASDHFSIGRQQSPFQGDGPSLPLLRAENRKPQDDNADLTCGIANFGSFDVTNGDNDGLLGLNALRGRAYSSPGPNGKELASSIHGQTISGRNDAIGQHLENEGNRSILADSRRPQAGSRDCGVRSALPPLSGGSVGSVGSNVGGGTQSPRAEGSSTLPSDRSLGGIFVPLTSGRNHDTSQAAVAQQDSGDSRGFGVISRPPGDEVGDIGPRRSSIGTERELIQSGYMNQNTSLAPGDRPQTVVDQSFAHKFGTMPSLASHLQHRVPPALHGPGQPQFNPLLPMQRHGRSLSVGGTVPDQMPMHDNASMLRLPHGTHGIETDGGQNRYRPTSSNGHHGRSLSGENFKPTLSRRSVSMCQNLSSSFDGNNASAPPRRNSQPNMAAVQGFYGQHQSLQGIHPTLQRRASGELVTAQGPVVASPEEMRRFGVNGPDNERQNSSAYNRQVSPAPSPLHVHYGGSHGRLPNDRVSGNMTSPLSLGNNMMTHQVGQEQQALDGSHFAGRGSNLEEELAHPLAGEHIEVPGEHSERLHSNVGFSHPGVGSGTYMVCEGASHHVMQASLSHSSSVDKLAQHYPGFDSSHHLPTAGAALPSPKVVYNVKFKRTQRSFVLGPRINRDLKIGTYVKVEADRGEDLGIVVGKIAADKYNFSGRPGYRSNNMNDIVPSPNGLSSIGAADLKCIIRLATHDEVSLLSMKRDEEEELLKICRGKVRQRGLPMNVVDAEYQFDRHKLTFFFEAEGRIDFRELVRDLFSMYKTRIWMQQLDKNVTSSGGSGMTAVVPPTNMMDYGTPIIAPASEFSDSFAMNGLAGGEARNS